MRIILSEPIVVAMGPESATTGWGPYQFPELVKLKDGRLLYNFNAGEDSVTAYGNPRPYYISDDNGRNWRRICHEEVSHLEGVMLPGGDVLRFRELPSIPTEGLALPKPVCTSPKGFDIYPIASIPETICRRNWEFIRNGFTEESVLNWPHMFTAAAKGVLIRLFPRGRIRVAPDGTLWMPSYCDAGIDPKDGSIASKQYSAYLFRSKDQGHTWDLAHFLPFIPETEEEAVSEGYNENDIGFAPDGSMFRLIRTHVIYAKGAFWPMVFTRSVDGGNTWSEPVPFDFTGVWPCILTLKCGVTLATYGRPGLFLRATDDPSCQVWEKPIELIHSTRRINPVGTSLYNNTCGYTELIPIDDHTAAMAYSDFTVKDKSGTARKTMMLRYITVET